MTEKKAIIYGYSIGDLIEFELGTGEIFEGEIISIECEKLFSSYTFTVECNSIKFEVTYKQIRKKIESKSFNRIKAKTDKAIQDLRSYLNLHLTDGHYSEEDEKKIFIDAIIDYIITNGFLSECLLNYYFLNEKASYVLENGVIETKLVHIAKKVNIK